MNRTNVQLLRDTLAKHYLAGEGIKCDGGRVGFNMRFWHLSIAEAAAAGAPCVTDKLDDCGTTACLGGWCEIISLGRRSAAEWLDLDWEQERALFYRYLDIDVTVPEALLVLDHLLATGKVDWSIILARREKLRTNGYVPASPVYGRPETVAP